MIEKFDKYVQGKMSDEEKKSFEENELQDESLKKEAAFEVGAREGIENNIRQDLRNTVNSFEKKQPYTSPSKNFKWIGIAASILILSGIAIYLGTGSSTYDQYYQPYPNYEFTSTRNGSSDEIKQAAYSAYDLGDYQRAVANFDRLLEVEDSPPEKFFRGISKIELEDFAGARVDLKEVLASGNVDYVDAANWYLALLAVKDSKTDLAREYLEKLENSEEFGDKVATLLTEL